MEKALFSSTGHGEALCPLEIESHGNGNTGHGVGMLFNEVLITPAYCGESISDIYSEDHGCTLCPIDIESCRNGNSDHGVGMQFNELPITPTYCGGGSIDPWHRKPYPSWMRTVYLKAFKASLIH